ncbi:MAG: L-serine ammonia-lyase, iron-sulfur-dependent, subunit alpha [Desulfobacterota bacterium]|nr:L-serine ammonia-lyase, iron-sulfur-dependent, subunit alpha [Thermodesulfobacteriota bacterium]
MNIYKELIAHEVFPALGCTEPIAVAYAAALAAAQLKGDVVEVRIEVDPGVFKNGFAVTVPNTGGEKGNLIAGALGALIARPELKMEILRGTNDTLLARARELVGSRQVSLRRDDQRVGLYIDVTVRSASGTARAVLEGGHTNLVKLEKNGAPLVDTADSGPVGTGHAYRERLRDMTVAGMIDLVEELNQDDLAYLRRGVEMNLALAEIGRSLGKVGHFISDLVSGGLLVDDVISKSKILTASASDARMAGLPYPAMASGGSGNQGIVASLVPYTVGRFYGVPDPTILKSIALSHLVNGYIKCYTGDLSPICGCAIAAGVGAAVAIVYQRSGKDLEKINLAVNTLVSDLGGMLCDGAKSGCALKVVSSTESAIRAAYMALHCHGITEEEGFVGRSAEETIKNMSRISGIGMSLVDETMLGIMEDKKPRGSGERN